jgi:hypothetical protein
LERRWNDALQKVQQLEARVEQAMRVQQVSPATKEEFEALAFSPEQAVQPGMRSAALFEEQAALLVRRDHPWYGTL